MEITTNEEMEKQNTNNHQLRNQRINLIAESKNSEKQKKIPKWRCTNTEVDKIEKIT